MLPGDGYRVPRAGDNVASAGSLIQNKVPGCMNECVRSLSAASSPVTISDMSQLTFHPSKLIRD